jgi:hypothetical protein
MTAFQANAFYIGYVPQTRGGRLSPAQTTTKDNCKLHSQWDLRSSGILRGEVW